jgi:hypothetical protein
MRRLWLLVVTTLFVSSCAFGDSIISVQPSTTKVMSGTSFSLTINISGATDLSAFQFDIKFNPNVLSATSVLEGSFLSSVGSTFFVPGTIGNGIIAFTADTLIGPGPGANGSGTLAIIDFTTIKPGISSIKLSNVFLLNSSGGNISFSVRDGKAVVGNLSTVPEPTSLSLVLIGVVGILFMFHLQATLVHRARRSSQITYPLGGCPILFTVVGQVPPATGSFRKRAPRYDQNL